MTKKSKSFSDAGEEGMMARQAEIRAELERVVRAARGAIRRAVAGIERRPEYAAQGPGAFLVSVIDGTSPFAPPALRAAGAQACDAHGVDREWCVRRLRGSEPVFAARLAVPSCSGHLGYIVTTDVGGAIGCVQCERLLEPSPEEDPRGRPS